MLGVGISIPAVAQRQAGGLASASAPYADHDVAWDFKNLIFRNGSLVRRDIWSMPGYSNVRSGSKIELSTTGSPLAYAAHMPGIVAGLGYWARPSLTNFVNNSNTMSAAGWSGHFAAKVAGQPDPITGSDAALITADGTNSAHWLDGPTVVFTSGTTYTASKLIKPTGGLLRAQLTLPASCFPATAYANFNLSGAGARVALGAGAINADIVPLSGGWFRVWITATATATAAAATPVLGFITGDTDTRLPVNTSSAAIYATGGQCVAGSLPGPIIVTTGAAATVGADDMRLSQPIPVDEDWIVYATAVLTTSAANQLLLAINDGTMNNRIALYSVGASLVAAVAVAGTVVVAGTAIGAAFTASGRIVIGLRRRGGKYTAFAKNAAGQLGASGESAVLAFPSGLTRIEVGEQLAQVQANGPIEFIGFKRGTFSDTDMNNLLAGA
jgi:hypothetical protein